MATTTQEVSGMLRDPLLAITTWTEQGYNRNGKQTLRIYRLRVTGGLHYLSGNARPHFSITADLDSRAATGGKFIEESGGCLHREIEQHFPGRFSDMIALHLSDDDGTPIHAEANGWYWLAGSVADGFGERYHGGTSKMQHWREDGSFDGYREPTQAESLAMFARHVRITDDDARQVRHDIESDYLANGAESARELFRAFIESQRDRWQAEASACIERHNLRVYAKMVR